MSTNDGGPAFPVPEGPHCVPQLGMSLRAYIATHVLAGIFSDDEVDASYMLSARHALHAADALIAELNK